MASEAWQDDGYSSRRWTEKFAWLPVKTLDGGWVFARGYWLQEIIWGWGFHERFKYAERTQEPRP